MKNCSNSNCRPSYSEIVCDRMVLAKRHCHPSQRVKDDCDRMVCPAVSLQYRAIFTQFIWVTFFSSYQIGRRRAVRHPFSAWEYVPWRANVLRKTLHWSFPFVREQEKLCRKAEDITTTTFTVYLWWLQYAHRFRIELCAKMKEIQAALISDYPPTYL